MAGEATKLPAVSNSRPSIAIVAGEVSGDLAGSLLANCLKEFRPDLQIWGMGSQKMKAAGVELLEDCSTWGAIGVVEVLKLYPHLRFRIYPLIEREIARRRPDVVVLIDFGAFNFKVARACKRLGVKVFYYFPPGSWKRKGKVGDEIAQIIDFIATPFPWSAKRLTDAGANAEFVGHPLLDVVKPSVTKAEFCSKLGIDPTMPVIGLLPGSRRFEIEHNLPAMIGAASLIERDMPGSQFVIGLASPFARALVENYLDNQRKALRAAHEALKQHPKELTGAEFRSLVNRLLDKHGLKSAPKLVTPEGFMISPEESLSREKAVRAADQVIDSLRLPPIVLAENQTYDLMAHSQGLLICSGTATLEAAIIGTPMVILYRGSKLMEMEAKVRRVRPEHIGLPNIIADKRIVPEFIQNDADPESLSQALLPMLKDPAIRSRIREDLEAVRNQLGSPGASRRTAEHVLRVAGISIGE